MPESSRASSRADPTKAQHTCDGLRTSRRHACRTQALLTGTDTALQAHPCNHTGARTPGFALEHSSSCGPPSPASPRPSPGCPQGGALPGASRQHTAGSPPGCGRAPWASQCSPRYTVGRVCPHCPCSPGHTPAPPWPSPVRERIRWPIEDRSFAPHPASQRPPLPNGHRTWETRLGVHLI